MHKYSAVIVVRPEDPSLPEQKFPLEHTTFIAVTSYQSNHVSEISLSQNKESILYTSQLICSLLKETVKLQRTLQLSHHIWFERTLTIANVHKMLRQ